MKRSNVIGILAAAAVIVLSVVLISWYLTKRTPTLIQGTVECTTYKASSKVPGRIDDMKVAQGDRVEKGQLLYTLSTPELEAKLRQAEAVLLQNTETPAHELVIIRLVARGARQLGNAALAGKFDPNFGDEHALHIKAGNIHVYSPLSLFRRGLAEHVVEHLTAVDHVAVTHRTGA